VHRFYEKPNLERAQHYFSAKDYYWNSGMFVWRADVILEEIKIYLPELYEGLLEIKASIGQANEQKVLEKVYPVLESISIDFGVLEHSKKCSVIAAEPFGWNDIGSWDAWAKHFEKDEAGNLTYGDVLSIDSEGCIIRSEKRFTAVLGATDLVVIDAGDALLVCPKDRVQDVKKIVEELGRQGREELI
jgi:mannose-1-phosphate guanylyltransferase